VLSATFPARDGQTRFLGDLVPGGLLTYTFRARAAVRLHDDSRPVSGAAAEYLWADTPVDNEGPRFVGLTAPAYLLAPGENRLTGYAYDPAGVTAVEIEIQGPGGTETLTCAPETPQSGTWGCPWTVSGQNGDTFALRLRGTDAYGQPGGWSAPRILLLDTQAPTVTLNLSSTQVVSGALLNDLSLPLYGAVRDAGGLGAVEVCLAGDCQPAALQLEAGQAAVFHEDAPGAGIPVGSGTPCGSGALLRTFTVTETFRVADIQVGFAASHSHRDDLRVPLTSPTGRYCRTPLSRTGSGWDSVRHTRTGIRMGISRHGRGQQR